MAWQTAASLHTAPVPAPVIVIRPAAIPAALHTLPAAPKPVLVSATPQPQTFVSAARLATLTPAPRVTLTPTATTPTDAAVATAAQAKKWYPMLASVYDSGGGGGSCGNLSDGKYHFAELGVAGNYGHGAAHGRGNIAADLGMPGQLPCGFGGWIRYNGKTTYATKADVGYGNPSVAPNAASQRRIDLLRNVADYLGFSGVGTVEFLPNTSGAPASNLPVTTSAGFVNPLEHANVRAERIDQGVDYAGTGYLVAIADGEVTISETTNTGWPGAFLEYKVTQPGPLEGVHFFYAEGITPDVRKNAKIAAGEKLATLIPGWHSGIELGVSAGDGTNRSWSAVNDGPYDEKSSRRAGIAMSNLIGTLGGPQGVLQSITSGKWPPFAPKGVTGVIRRVTPAPYTAASGPAVGGVFDLFDAVNWAGDVDNAFKYLSDGATKAKRTSAATRAFVLKHVYVTRAA